MSEETLANDQVSPVASAAASTPYPGASVPGRPGWRFAARLGEGAFGDVWRIVHASTGRFEALKLARTREGKARLEREAAVLARLHERLGPTRHLLRLFESQFAREPAWMALDHVPGGSLAQRLAPQVEESTHRPLEPHQVVPLFRGICEGMAAAHRVGVVHRDLKPSNILLDFDLTPVICDFGARLRKDTPRGGTVALHATQPVATEGRAEHASMTLSGLLATGSADSLGTHGYASPEQRDGAAPSPTDDVYALGVILFQLLLGTTTRWPDYPRETLKEEAREPVSESLIALVEGCLAHPKRRPADANALLQRLPASSRQAPSSGRAPRVTASTRTAPPPATSPLATKGAQGSTWLVDPSGHAHGSHVVPTIAHAVVRAAAGDVVRIRPGHYHEHVEIDRALHLMGEEGLDDRAVVLHGHRGPCVTVSASRVTLTGLELRSGSGGPAVLVHGGARRVRLKSCRLVRLREPRKPRDMAACDAAHVGFVAAVEDEKSSLMLHACTVAGSLCVTRGNLTLVECDNRVEGEPAIHASQFGRVAAVRSRFTSMTWNPAHGRTAGIEAHGPGCQVLINQGRFDGFVVHARLAGLGTRMTASDVEFRDATHTALEVHDAAEASVRRCRFTNSRLFHVHVFDGARARLTRCMLGGEASAGVRTGPGGWAVVQECRFTTLTGTPLLREPGSNLHTHDTATAPYTPRQGHIRGLMQFASRLTLRGLQAILVVTLYGFLGAVLGFCLAGLPALAFALHLGWSTGGVLLFTTLAGGAVALLGALIALAVPTLRFVRRDLPQCVRMRRCR